MMAISLKIQMRNKHKPITYVYILPLLVDQQIVVHVVVQNAVADTELKLLQELHIVHYIEAVEHIKSRSIGHHLLGENKCIFHHFRQLVYRGTIVVKVGNLVRQILVINLKMKNGLLTFIFV